MRRHSAAATLLAAAVSTLALACSGPDAAVDATTVAAAPAACDPDNGGITLPAGFCATVFADDVGAARHLAVAPNGDVFVAIGGGDEAGVLALRDTTGDGHADVRVRWPQSGGTGIALRDGYLYFAANDAVLRYPRASGSLQPSGPPDTIVGGLPARPGHSAKSIALLGDTLFVNIGSPSNSCQREDRSNGSPGLDPCPQLDTRAGIWRFALDRTGQTQADGTRFATGIRNAVGLAVDPRSGTLYATQHGRDQLFQNWGDRYTAEQGAELPAEELLRVHAGDDFGWPYCYYDQNQSKLVLAPEYGGDGQEVGRCATRKAPIAAFPGHWAPDGLLVYTGRLFPERFRGGAFIAFHGSWNRAPLAQAGYKVVFVPMSDGAASGDFTVFADGFAGGRLSPRDAAHRPTGLAQGPDGALYISDDQGGRIWRVVPAPASR